MSHRTRRLLGACRTVLFIAFCLAIVVVPMEYGSNTLNAWTRNALVFGAIGILSALLALIDGRSRPWPFALAPTVLILGVLIFIALQIVPWMPSWLANPIWSAAADALGGPGASRGAISVDPDLTALAAFRLLTTLLVLWLAADLARDEARAVGIVAVAAAAGLAYAAYGFAVPPQSTTLRGAFMSSVFISRNNFATYVGIALLCVCGLLVRQFRRRSAGHGHVARLQWAAMIDFVLGRGAVLLLAALLLLVALFLSGSRGGIASGLFGLLVLAVVMRPRTRSIGGGAILALVLGAVVAAALIAGEVFQTRVAEQGLDDPSRVRVYLITLRSIAASPWLGYGYGTFERVFPMFRDASLDAVLIWEKAHSSYLEIYQGLGIVAGSAFFAAWGLVIRLCYRQARQGRRSRTVPAVAAACSALVAAHSVVDFSLQIQAIALTYAAILGAGLAQSIEPQEAWTADH
ncbi:O-antigen ligase family protein [Alsobacter sp. R-9]